ncbi:MAG: PilN domain-containing protein [Candidatus Aminicenantales bacterium]
MIRINLLKPETKDVRETSADRMPEAGARKSPQIGNLILLLLVVGIGAFYFYQNKAMNQEKELLSQAQQEKSKLQYVIAKLDELQKQKDSLQMKIGLINQLKSQQDMAVRIMDDLSRSLPDWIWLTEFTYDAKGIQIKGNALSNNLLADFISNLEATPYFDSVNLISSTQRTVKNDQYLEFALTAKTINPRQAQAPPPPAKEAKKRSTT